MGNLITQFARASLVVLSCASAAMTHAWAEEPVIAPTGNYVGLVIGISSYEHLPDEVELDYARAEAAQIAKVLREDAKFTHVFQLGDGEARRADIVQTLRDRISPLLGPQDVFVLYFTGHGLGSDLGIPVFFAFDSTLQNGQEDGLELGAFARDLVDLAPAGTTLVVTDAIHPQTLEGFRFFGPAAGEWPTMPRNTMIVSATQSRTPGRDGAFGPVFARAIGGSADSNRDTMVTASELIGYLVTELSTSGQIPVAAGDFPGSMVLAAGVTPPPEAPEPEPGPLASGPTKPEYTGPRRDIRSAKFIWTEGSGQRITCENVTPVSCEPSCYARRFPAGACMLEAVIDGVPMSGWVIIDEEGAYRCGTRGPELACDGA